MLTRPRAPPPAGREVVLAACAVTTLVPFGSTSIAVALPEVRAAFGVGVGPVVAVVTAYLVVTAACQPLAGALGDRWGQRRTVLAGVAGFGVASLLAVLAPTLPALVAARCTQAVCGALALVNAAALVRVSVAGERRGRAFGAVAAAATAAAAAGPALGGTAVQAFGWRGVFLAGLPLVAVALATSARGLPADPPRAGRRPPFDLPGAALLLLVLGGGSTLLTAGGRLPGRLDVPAVLLLAAAAALFVRVELRHPAPVLDVRVLRSRGVAAAGAAVATANAALYTVLLAVPLLVGSGPAVGLLLPLLVGASLASLLGGRLSDRWGRREPAVLGGALVCGAALALLAVDLREERLLAGVLLAAAGAGQGVAAAAVQTAGLEALPPERAGLASGVWSSCRYSGSIIGSSLLALLVATGSGRGVFVLAAAAGALSVGAAAALPRSRAAPPP